MTDRQKILSYLFAHKISSGAAIQQATQIPALKLLRALVILKREGKIKKVPGIFPGHTDADITGRILVSYSLKQKISNQIEIPFV
jgi:hypothetical protein